MASETATNRYVGTLVGESTSAGFRLALAHESVREQDIIAVDATLRSEEGGTAEAIRIWAKVQRIERLNPLFPSEAAHELAATQTDPLDTVLSLSREMVTAVCSIIGAEPRAGAGGQLDHLRYPPRPASSAYRPAAHDIARVLLGALDRKRALDIATLSTRPDVDVAVDGHTIVTRHLAILAMTGAGKSWAARRIIEELAAKDYPLVIFDPHGDYTGLAAVPHLRDRVRLYYAELPIFEEASDDAARIVGALSGEEMSPPQLDLFETLFRVVRDLAATHLSGELAAALFAVTTNHAVTTYPLRRDLFLLANIAEAMDVLARNKNASGERERLKELGLGDVVVKADQRTAGTFNALKRQLRKAAFELHNMQSINRRQAGNAAPLPQERLTLVAPGQITVVSLAGYTEAVQATLYTLIARHLFRARVQRRLAYPYMMVLEEAHNFVPGQAHDAALNDSIAITKQIAQEGRKFNVGLLLISQRPSRLDETTLSQCNSFLIMRMVNPADQSFVRRVIETLGDDEAQMLPDLDVGEALLSGQLINVPVLVRMKPPASKGEREEEDAFAVLAKARAAAQR